MARSCRRTGRAFAASTSTWIHWWSPVASANWSIRSWPIVVHSVAPRSVPTASVSAASESKCIAAVWQNHPRRSGGAPGTVGRMARHLAPGGILGGPVDGPARLAAEFPAQHAVEGTLVLHRASGFAGRIVRFDTQSEVRAPRQHRPGEDVRGASRRLRGRGPHRAPRAPTGGAPTTPTRPTCAAARCAPTRAPRRAAARSTAPRRASRACEPHPRRGQARRRAPREGVGRRPPHRRRRGGAARRRRPPRGRDPRLRARPEAGASACSSTTSCPGARRRGSPPLFPVRSLALVPSDQITNPSAAAKPRLRNAPA